jgi:Transcription termination factor
LFKIAVKDDKNIQDLINEYTPEWDNDRIAVIDMIILKMCINEFTSFPSIPVKVSINEYVEISKEYSSPNSSTFINGVLNNIYRKLDKEGMINKNERGSQ